MSECKTDEEMKSTFFATVLHGSDFFVHFDEFRQNVEESSQKDRLIEIRKNNKRVEDPKGEKYEKNRCCWNRSQGRPQSRT